MPSLSHLLRDMKKSYQDYVNYKKTPNQSSNGGELKKNMVMCLYMLTKTIVGDREFFKEFIKKQQRETSKIDVCCFLSILTDTKIDIDFDDVETNFINFLVQLDLKTRFILLIYIIFNFIKNPGLELSNLIPCLNQCIYEFSINSKCPSCSISMNGDEILKDDGYFYCWVCKFRHDIPQSFDVN